MPPVLGSILLFVARSRVPRKQAANLVVTIKMNCEERPLVERSLNAAAAFGDVQGRASGARRAACIRLELPRTPDARVADTAKTAPARLSSSRVCPRL